MPRTERGWIITPGELRQWTVHEDTHVLVLNKPAFVVCHPSKFGPWSSLVGACREYLGLEQVHLPVRLDRETSGVVVIAKDRETGVRLHRAMANREVRKTYLAVLQGELNESQVVDAPLGRDLHSEYTTRQAILPEGQSATTQFIPIHPARGFTLARAVPKTGRMHQIRAHAAHIGHPIVGDKLYGRDSSLMLEFIRDGFTDAMRKELLLDRHALHATELAFADATYTAPLTPDLRDFLRTRVSIDDSIAAQILDTRQS